jgi:hypothetical protein
MSLACRRAISLEVAKAKAESPSATRVDDRARVIHGILPICPRCWANGSSLVTDGTVDM